MLGGAGRGRSGEAPRTPPPALWGFPRVHVFKELSDCHRFTKQHRNPSSSSADPPKVLTPQTCSRTGSRDCQEANSSPSQELGKEPASEGRLVTPPRFTVENVPRGVLGLALSPEPWICPSSHLQDTSPRLLSGFLVGDTPDPPGQAGSHGPHALQLSHHQSPGHLDQKPEKQPRITLPPKYFLNLYLCRLPTPQSQLCLCIQHSSPQISLLDSHE